jgi:hypothetical protein
MDRPSHAGRTLSTCKGISESGLVQEGTERGFPAPARHRRVASSLMKIRSHQWQVINAAVLAALALNQAIQTKRLFPDRPLVLIPKACQRVYIRLGYGSRALMERCWYNNFVSGRGSRPATFFAVSFKNLKVGVMNCVPRSRGSPAAPSRWGRATIGHEELIVRPYLRGRA